MLATLRAIPRFVRSYRVNKRLAEQLAVAQAQTQWMPIEVAGQFGIAVAVVRAPKQKPALALHMQNCGGLSGWYSLGGKKPKLPWEPTEFWLPPFNIENLKEI